MLCQVVFLLTLTHYVLHPPTRLTISYQPLEYVGIREVILMLISTSLVINEGVLTQFPFLLTLLAFISELPSVPFPENTSFSILLWALSLHLLQLHLPQARASPLLLFSPRKTLPLAYFLQTRFRQILSSMIFFLPVFIFSSYLLSVSLADTFLQVLSAPTPMVTRTGLLLLSFIVILFTSSCFLTLLISLPFTTHDTPEALWCGFSQPVARQSRRRFFSGIVHYAAPFRFPAPFNLLRVVLVTIPLVACRVFGAPSKWVLSAERLLWRTVVTPIAAITGIFLRFLPIE